MNGYITFFFNDKNVFSKYLRYQFLEDNLNNFIIKHQYE